MVGVPAPAGAIAITRLSASRLRRGRARSSEELDVDRHSLEVLEFDRVCASIAERAECDLARARLRAWAPFGAADGREREIARLHAALMRQREPGAWCAVGPATLAEPLAPDARDPLDGPLLVGV